MATPVRQPQDRKPPAKKTAAKKTAAKKRIPTRDEAEAEVQLLDSDGQPIVIRTKTVEWDGEEWELDPNNATGMEFYALLADAEDEEDPMALVRALRHLLGREQAARLFKGRTIPQIHDFFDAMGEAVGTGNP